MTIAYAIGLSMGWDRPYWAGFVVAFISLATTGQSFNKASLRMLGTVLGAFVALIAIGLSAQDRWLFITLLSLWCGFCAYMMGGRYHQYFWHVAGFVFVIICIDGGPSPDNAFSTAMLRLQQTALGILVYSVVAVLLWPTNSRQAMESTALALLDTQISILASYLRLFQGQDDAEIPRSGYVEEITKLNQLGVLLDAATTDSQEVQEVKGGWRDYQSAAGELTETMQQWQESLPDLRGLMIEPLMPDLVTFSAELVARLKSVKQLLEREDDCFACSDVRLEIKPRAARELDHLQWAALTVARDHLIRLEELTRRLHQSARVIRGDEGAPVTTNTRPSRARPAFIPDPDRMLAAGKVVVTVWLAFLAVVYIGDFPGGFGVLSLAAPVSMALFNMPQLPVSALYRPAAFGVAFGSAMYLLVMPHLHSFLGLGTMLFAGTFFLCQRFSKPQQMLGRALGLAMFLSLISVSNQQSYHFLSVANTALMLSLILLLLSIVAYIPDPPRPERALLRMLRRYFRSASFLLSQPATGSRSRYEAWREAFHLKEITTLPYKMAGWAGQADPGVLGEGTVKQLPELFACLQALSFRHQELARVRRLPQSPSLVTGLKEDMLAWRKKVLDVLDKLASDPSQTRNLRRAHLKEQLDSIENRIEHVLKEQGSNIPSEEYRGNFYRLLGAYRGSSEALLDFAELGANVDWAPWYEERFA